MNDKATLREKAREAIQCGKLPAMKPSRPWGGPGSGTPCSVCGEPVKPGQMEPEIEYRRDGETLASTITAFTSGASPRRSAKANISCPGDDLLERPGTAAATTVGRRPTVLDSAAIATLASGELISLPR
jgi:hypothetical protein